MKYKIGDKVKIREDLEIGKEYNDCSFIKNMEQYKGKIATIYYCYSDGSYDIDLDDGEWYWTDDMLEDVVEEEAVESENEKTVDIGYYLEYCGHRVIQNVYYGGYARDHYHVFCTTVNGKNQYTLPVDSVEFIVPHED